ncbi:hypothetical protein O181_031405 [Austropuccinia psidii MF-1]|uniref:RecA family profile 1 domain-containing protein n=1 Tax=Austropuccinia psidii MF-1 TaxID=1389203 RepID=A0A9Q3CZ04_9BASI|nr:hypothetical protein [Austropuccinia psidii MF-1]
MFIKSSLTGLPDGVMFGQTGYIRNLLSFMPLHEEPLHALHVSSPAIWTLNELPQKYIQRLQRAGFTTASEIILLRPESLRSKTGLSTQDVQDLYKRLSEICSPTPRTVLEILSEIEGSFISLGSAELDRLFGDPPTGIPTGLLTEISGESSSGKTCMALQLALNVQLPVPLGGLGGGCVYLCTESAFPSSRLYEMAKGVCERYGQSGTDQIKISSFMDNVHLLRVQDSEVLIHTVHYSLPAFLSRQHEGNQHSMPIKLIVLDSIAAVFRTELEPNRLRDNKARMTERATGMNQVADALKYLANQYQLAVVVINQVSNVVDTSSGTSQLTPFGIKPNPTSSLSKDVKAQLIVDNDGMAAPERQASSSSGTMSSADREPLPLPLTYQQQAYYFTGQEVTNNRKEAALGFTWTNAINSRIMLRLLNYTFFKPVPNNEASAVRYSNPRVREARIVFSPFGKTRLDQNRKGVKYIIESQGIIAITD